MRTPLITRSERSKRTQTAPADTAVEEKNGPMPNKDIEIISSDAKPEPEPAPVQPPSVPAVADKKEEMITMAQKDAAAREAQKQKYRDASKRYYEKHKEAVKARVKSNRQKKRRFNEIR